MTKKFFDISPVNTPEGPFLKITDRFGKGVGITHDENSALVRPYRRFLEDRTKIGSVKYICFKEKNNYFVLGSFVFTSKKRILFFPGTRGRKLVRPPGKLIKEKLKQTSSEIIGTSIDHITLEPVFKKWHVKLLDRETWFKAQQTMEINNSLYLWCQLQIKSLNELETLPEKQEVFLKIPDNPLELVTILPILRDSRDDTIIVIHLEDETTDPFFWAFQIFVSSTKVVNFPNLLPTRINRPPYVFVDDSRPTQKDTIKQIELEGFNGAIWLRTYKIPGKMTEGTFIMSGDGIPKQFVVP